MIWQIFFKFLGIQAAYNVPVNVTPPPTPSAPEAVQIEGDQVLLDGDVVLIV